MTPIRRHGRVAWLTIALVTAVIGVSAFVGGAVAAGNTLSITPAATGGLAVGDTFTIRVVLNAGEATSGVAATVTFDPKIVQLQSFVRGAQWAQAPLLIAGNTVAAANQLGALKNVAAAFFPPDSVPAGQSDVLSLTFQVVACGSTWLGVPTGKTDSQVLGGTSADYGSTLPLTTTGGTATACPGSTPAPSPTPSPSGSSRPTPVPTPTPTPTPPPPPLPAARGWVVHDLGTLGGNGSTATAINANGQVVGSSTRADGKTHAFLWDRGRMRDLGTLGGSDSSAVLINDRGDILGQSLTRTGAMHSFLWSHGRMTDLGEMTVFGGEGGLSRGGIAIGNRFAVPVQAIVIVGGVPAALPSLGESCDATAINDRNVIAGNCWVGGDPHAVIWTRR
jgi:probable HAF family extracellular repeat protein